MLLLLLNTYDLSHKLMCFDTLRLLHLPYLDEELSSEFSRFFFIFTSRILRWFGIKWRVNSSLRQNVDFNEYQTFWTASELQTDLDGDVGASHS